MNPFHAAGRAPAPASGTDGRPGCRPVRRGTQAGRGGRRRPSRPVPARPPVAAAPSRFPSGAAERHRFASPQNARRRAEGIGSGRNRPVRSAFRRAGRRPGNCGLQKIRRAARLQSARAAVRAAYGVRRGNDNGLSAGRAPPCRRTARAGAPCSGSHCAGKWCPTAPRGAKMAASASLRSALFANRRLRTCPPWRRPPRRRRSAPVARALQAPCRAPAPLHPAARRLSGDRRQVRGSRTVAARTWPSSRSACVAAGRVLPSPGTPPPCAAASCCRSASVRRPRHIP